MRRRDFIAGLSSAAVWPLAARAQQRSRPVIGIISPDPEVVDRPFANVFLNQGLSEHGYVEGRNVEVLYRFADNQYDRLSAMASDLVRRRVSVIAAFGSATLAAKAATATIPIVFGYGANPVELGLVASLNRPGGNVTGVTFLTRELIAKRLELLHEIVPSATSLGLLTNPTVPTTEIERREATAATRNLSVQLMIFNASTPAEIDVAFASVAGQRVGALLVGGDALFGPPTAPQLVELAARYRVPAIYPMKESVEAGGLMSYGPSIPEAFRLVGNYIGRILKGERPAELPVQQSTRIDMVLNLKTAKALGIEVPTATLLRATEVIE